MRRPLGAVIALLVAIAAVGACSGGDGGEKVSTNAGAAGLSQAFAGSANATSYRITQFMGADVQIGPLGVNEKTEIDLGRPSLVGSISAGRSHVRVDIGMLLEALGQEPEDLFVDMWFDDHRAVIDTRAFELIEDQNPGATLGPFAPGVAYVDLDRMAAESPDLVSALVGSGLVDLSALAEHLPAALEDVEQDSDGNYHGTASYAVVVEAMGGDIDDIARSAAAGVAQNLRMDPVRLARVYADGYRSAESEVVVEVEDGAVSVIRMVTDLSDIFGRIASRESGLLDGMSDGQVREVADAFAGSRMVVSLRIEFEVDPELQVPEPPATDDDRTELWADMLKAAM